MKKITWYAALPLMVLPLVAAVVLTGCFSTPAVVEADETGNGSAAAALADVPVAAPADVPAGGTTSEKAVLQNRYMAYLREEGYSPSIDSDGDVLFKIQGKSYFIIVNAEDAAHFLILYPNFWNANTAAKRQQAALAASYASRRTKVARAYLGSNNYVSASSEVFLNDPDDYRYIFPRMIRTITTVIDHFEEYLEE